MIILHLYISDTEYGFGIMNKDVYDVSVICSTQEIKKKKLDIDCTTNKREIPNILNSRNQK
jgi:hypothetical protein